MRRPTLPPRVPGRARRRRGFGAQVPPNAGDPFGQRGLALIAVLWMVAALMVATAGVVHAVRGEVRSVAAFREMAAAGALADAGVVLAARELAGAPQRETLLQTLEFDVDQSPVGVRIVPLTGLVDLNAAAEPLLTELIAVAGGVERRRAESLAQRILDWRDADDQVRPDGAEDAAYAAAGSPFRTRGGPFEAPEDLLQVLGIDFELYSKLRPLVTVHLRGNGRVDPAAAPLAVLRVLAAGDDTIAEAYARAREASGLLADTTRFPAAYTTRQPASRYLIESAARLTTGASLVSRNVVEVGSRRRGGLPWQVIWSERVVEPADEG